MMPKIINPEIRQHKDLTIDLKIVSLFILFYPFGYICNNK